MADASERLAALPRRILLDTNILNALQDNGEYIWDGVLPDGIAFEKDVADDLRALRSIFAVNERANLQFVVSPLSIGELAAIPDFRAREARVRWALDVLDHWHITLWEVPDTSVRQRRTLPQASLDLEQELMQLADFRKSPYDRLLLIEMRLAACDRFLTLDRKTILRHKSRLSQLGIPVMSPVDFWELLEPWAALWC